MLATGRSFPAVTTVRRASVKTIAAGRTWRSTQGSFPSKNVRGLSSEGTPGTVAGVKAAGVLRVVVDAISCWERSYVVPWYGLQWWSDLCHVNAVTESSVCRIRCTPLSVLCDEILLLVRISTRRLLLFCSRDYVL